MTCRFRFEDAILSELSSYNPARSFLPKLYDSHLWQVRDAKDSPNRYSCIAFLVRIGIRKGHLWQVRDTQRDCFFLSQKGLRRKKTKETRRIPNLKGRSPKGSGIQKGLISLLSSLGKVHFSGIREPISSLLFLFVP